MVEFRRHVKRKQRRDARDLCAFFESLDRSSTHTELRQVQSDILRGLSGRLDARDVLLKVSTGAGKTVAALLFLASRMEQLGRPAVYLCPTVQLVDQVCSEAARIGIDAVPYRSGERQPSVKGTSAAAVIVCTYDKLFNARTTFDRSEVMLRPGAVALDDAHTGVDRIRSCFRMRIGREAELERELLDLLDAACSRQYPGAWPGIREGDPLESIEVPYWVWASAIDDVRELVEPHRDEHLEWAHIRDVLRYCRCIVSGEGIEISPIVLPVQNCRAFSEAPHRLFLSATLADDAVLVRDLCCDPEAVENPVVASGDRGLGERMVIPPSLVDTSLNREWVARVCAELSKKVNVVVLSPSAQAARTWVDAGAQHVAQGGVAEAVGVLKASQGNYYVFAQRYDGVDLPDAACRVLVIDGLPIGECISDRHYSSQRGETPYRLIHRVEQGMGRAVRSHVDYAVVLLAGPEIASFTARADVLLAMNVETQAQLRVALELAELAKAEEEASEAVWGLTWQCLNRDEGWKQFYRENVREAAASSSSKWQSVPLTVAAAYRRSFDLATANDARGAAAALEAAIDEHLSDDKASHLQLVANYTHDYDQGKALEIQRSVFDSDRTLLRPPAASARRPSSRGSNTSAQIIRTWFGEFSNPNGALAAIEEFRTRLSFARSPDRIEEALKDLAYLVGAEGSRPEKELGEGPDVLWLWGEESLVIEAKTQNKNSLHKKDAGQLLGSLQWFERTYPSRGEPTPVMVAGVVHADRLSDFPNGVRVLTPECVAELLDKLRSMFEELAHNPLAAATDAAVAGIVSRLRLGVESVVGAHTEQLQGMPRRVR